MKTACLCFVACFVCAASLPSYCAEGKKASDRFPLTAAAPPVYKFVELNLFSRRIDASGEAVKLNLPLPAGGNVLQYEISPDSERVVYRVADRDEFGYRYSDIYSARLDGRGLPVKINGRDSAKSWSITPDSRHVVWLDSQDALYSQNLAGNVVSVKLGLPGRLCTWLWISPDSKRVLFNRAGDIVAVRGPERSTVDLYSTPIDGRAAPVKMNGPRQTDVQQFQTSADGKWVVYLDGFNIPDSLYSQPIEGGGPVALNGAMKAYTNLAVSRDGRQVVFRGKSGSTYSLYSVPIDGSRPPFNLSGSIGDIGAAFSYACKISPDSRRVVFQIGENFALWSRPIERGGEPVMLCGATYVRYFAVSPDGKRAVYLARSGADGVATYHLCSRSLDGSDAPVELYSPSRRREFVYIDFQISPDSRRVVFRVAPDVRTDLYGLYSRPIDGSGSLARLSDSPKTEGDLYAFDITPDSRQVIYLAGPSKLTRQVHARPIDGSGKSVRISEPLGEDGGVCNFQISPDGQRILYLAYRSTKALRENDSNEGPGIHQPFRDTPYKASTY